MCRRRGRFGPRVDGLVWGFMLIGLGTWFLLVMNEMLPEEGWHRWWPAVVIVAGAVGLAGARDPKSVGSGVTTIGMGTWMLIAVNHWYGLNWSRSWPLALVAAGLGVLAEWLSELISQRMEGAEHVG